MPVFRLPKSDFLRVLKEPKSAFFEGLKGSFLRDILNNILIAHFEIPVKILRISTP